MKRAFGGSFCGGDEESVGVSVRSKVRMLNQATREHSD